MSILLNRRLTLLLALVLPSCVSTSKSVATSPLTLVPDSRKSTYVNPNIAIGGGIDGQPLEDATNSLSIKNRQLIAKTGFSRYSYRLRTELAGEVWHWSKHGKFSDGKTGYWISSADNSTLKSPSFGYTLPRRGNTVDQANNDGFSRITDGNEQSFWKSNPYLDRYYAGQDAEKYPQWIILDFHHPEKINALKIAWGNPCATSYKVQYLAADIEDPDYINDDNWKEFPIASFESKVCESGTIKLSDTPIRTGAIKIILLTHPEIKELGDIRDQLGFAVREVGVGTIDINNNFEDIVVHSPNKHQTSVTVSSTDPWHGPNNQDAQTTQPALEKLVSGPLNTGEKPILSFGITYDTPENAASFANFLSTTIKPAYLELGEEPDGQPIQPEHFGMLFLQFAKSIKSANPNIVVGGPSLETQVYAGQEFDFAAAGRSWMGRFINYLRAKGALSEFGFFSFEWYPFDDLCADPWTLIPDNKRLLLSSLNEWRDAGIPQTIPWIMTEYGYSAYATRAEIDLSGALLNAESVLEFLAEGGAEAHFYGVEPAELDRDDSCGGWGTTTLYTSNAEHSALKPTAAFWISKMLSELFANRHKVYAIRRLRCEQALGCQTLRLYLVSSKDSDKVIIINQAPQPATINNEIELPDGVWHPTAGKVLSPDNYHLSADGPEAQPVRDSGPTTLDVTGATLIIPEHSFAVLSNR